MKLHPRSLVLRALPRGIQTGSFGFFIVMIASSISSFPGWFELLIAVTVVGFLGGTGYELLYYRRFEYELTSDTLDINSGVFSRRKREIPLRRIQNIDISRELAQRALGLAAIDIETGSGGETEASLKYVGDDEAKRLQREIRYGNREREIERTTSEPATERGEVLFELTDRNLLMLGLVSPDFRALFPVLFLVIPALGFSIPDVVAESGAFAVGPRAAVLAVVSWVGSGAVTAARYYDFRLIRLGDELRYERGLFSRYDGSIPLDKIQQVDIRENVLMRRFGYAALVVETAGYTTDEGQRANTEATVPLAGREHVLELTRDIPGFEFDDPDFTRPPRRTRRRYAVRYTLAVVVVTGVLYAVNAVFDAAVLRFWSVPLLGLVFVPVAAHYKWLHRGYALDTEHVLTRNGFWRRTIAVVPAYRVQTLIQTATVFQRWRSLASVAIDTAGSLSITDRGARAVDFDANEVTELKEEVRGRLHERLVARRQRPSESFGTISDKASETENRNRIE